VPPATPTGPAASPDCPIVCAASALGRIAVARFPHATRALALLCLAAVAAWGWNARLPLGIRWLPSPGNRVGIPRAFEKRLPEINVARALQLYEAADALFVDSRDQKDYEKDHIPGAVSLPMREWATAWPKMRDRLPKDRLLVLYCYGAHCGLSTRQGKALLENGYSKLVILDYGWKTWTEADGPTVKRPRARER